MGRKNNPLEPIVIKDPDTGKLLYSPNEKNNASLKYGVNLLKNKEPHKDYEEIISQKEKHHNERMLEVIQMISKKCQLIPFCELVRILRRK